MAAIVGFVGMSPANATGVPMTERVLSLPDVQTATSLGRSSIYEGVSAGTFPKPIKLTERRVGWIASEIEGWIAARASDRGPA